MDNKTFREQLRQWESQVKTFLVSFLATFFTQLLTMGSDNLDKLRTYAVSAGVSLVTLMVRYFNPKDKAFGRGAEDNPDAE